MEGGAREVLRIGKVSGIVGGLAVIRTDMDVRKFRQGAPVVNSERRLVGSAADIIGNVNSPYLLVKLSPGASVKEGDELFLIFSPPRRRGHHRRR